MYEFSGRFSKKHICHHRFSDRPVRKDGCDGYGSGDRSCPPGRQIRTAGLLPQDRIACAADVV